MACATESCASTVMILPLMRMSSEEALAPEAVDCAPTEMEQSRLLAKRATVREEYLRKKVIVPGQLRLLLLHPLQPTCTRATDRLRREHRRTTGRTSRSARSPGGCRVRPSERLLDTAGPRPFPARLDS